MNSNEKKLEVNHYCFFNKPETDLVALPDFASGAMENWGLITFRENYLLYNEKLPSLENKMLITMVVAHELAHQWFGNLVTPKWWDDLWLNEGFATYVEYLGSDSVAPEWKMVRMLCCLKQAIQRKQMFN